MSLTILGWQFHRTRALEARVLFDVSFDGKQTTSYRASLNDAYYTPDLSSGLGRKTLKIEAPDAEPFETNFFVWYGGRSLETIKLEPTRGTLDLDVAPVSNVVSVIGHEFRKEIQNCGREAVLLRTGDYEVQARFERFSVTNSVIIRRAASQVLTIKPQIAALQIISEPSESRFRLDGIRHRQISIEGTTPVTMQALPVSEYRLAIWRDDYRKIIPVHLSTEPTNQLSVRFDYGNLSFTTDPAEAAVYEGDNLRAKTPASLSFPPGTYRFRIEKEGHYPTNIEVSVAAGESREINVALQNIAFTEALEKARIDASQWQVNYARAIAEIEKALKINPESAAAKQLHSELLFGQHLASAKELRKHSRYSDALVEVGSALKINATDPDALSLKDALEIERKIAVDAETFAKAEARRNRPRDVFRKSLTGTEHHELFEEQVMHLSGSLETVNAALTRALSRNPEWTIHRHEDVDSDVVMIQAERKFIGMKYSLILVAGQTADNSVTVSFKILQFIFGGKIHISLDGISGGGYIPYHPRYSSVAPNSIANQVTRDIQHLKKRIKEELH